MSMTCTWNKLLNCLLWILEKVIAYVGAFTFYMLKLIHSKQRFSACCVRHYPRDQRWIKTNSFFQNSSCGGDKWTSNFNAFNEVSFFFWSFGHDTLHCMWHLSSQTRDWTHTFYTGSTQSKPLDHQVIQRFFFFNLVHTDLFTVTVGSLIKNHYSSPFILNSTFFYLLFISHC